MNEVLGRNGPPNLYVGLTGVTNSREVSHLARFYLEQPYAQGDHLRSRQLKLGILMRQAALTGVDAASNGRHVASFDALRSLLADEHYPGVHLILHLCRLTGAGLQDALPRLLPLMGRGLDGVQLCCTEWPSAESLVAFREGAIPYRDAAKPAWLIVQLSPQLLDQTPEGVVAAVNRYPKLARPTHVLIDSSGGRGRPFEPDHYMSWLRHLSRGWSSVALGVAGGLSGENLDCLDPLLDTNVPFSVDAESRLMGRKGQLDLELAERYLRGMNAVLQRPAYHR